MTMTEIKVVPIPMSAKVTKLYPIKSTHIISKSLPLLKKPVEALGGENNSGYVSPLLGYLEF